MFVVEIAFSELLVLLLPGFLSLWVFGRVTAEDFDKRGEWTLVSLGLCFGMSNLAVLMLVSLVVPWVDLNNLSSGFPYALSFWASYGVLVVVALVVGGGSGVLRASDIWPAHWVGTLGAKAAGRQARLLDYEGTLSYLENNVFHEKTIVRVSSLSCRENGVVGFWAGLGDDGFFRLRHAGFLDAGKFPYGLEFDVAIDYRQGLVFEFITEDATCFVDGVLEHRQKGHISEGV